MTKPTILSEEPINLAQLKEEIAKMKKRDGELNFRSNKTDEYLQQLSIPTKATAKALYEKIVSMGIPRLKDVHIHKIIDLQPKSIDELKVVLQGYTLTVKADNQKKIVESVVEVLGN